MWWVYVIYWASVLFGGYLIYKSVRKFIVWHIDNFKGFRYQLKNMTREKYEHISDVGDRLCWHGELIEEHPVLAKIYTSKIKDNERQLLAAKEEFIRIYNAEQKEKIKLEKERQIKFEKINKLVKYFLKQDSDETIPEWALKFDEYLIERAKERFRKKEEEKEEKENQWREVVKFVSKHKAYPSDFSSMDNIEKSMYVKAIKLLKQGNLEEIEDDDEEDEPDEDEDELEENKNLRSKKFYHADDLKPEERDMLISRYGYKHKPFIYRDGSSGNNLIIKNDKKNESDYHFCMKHLFAELDSDSAKIEYAIGDFRTDVAFIMPDKRIAVEIETGSNKELQIKNKVAWLNKHFDYWIFICPRDKKKVYKQYIDNKKSFCLTLGQADRKVEDLLLG